MAGVADVAEVHRRAELRYRARQVIEEHARRRGRPSPSAGGPACLATTSTVPPSPASPASHHTTTTTDAPLVHGIAGRLIGPAAGMLEGLAAPTNRITAVDERGRSYDELLRPGCFAASIRARPRVPIVIGHRYDELPLAMGDLEERTDGLYVRFRPDASDRADDVLEAIFSGWRPALSIGFVPVRERRTPAGSRRAGRDLIEREEVDVREVSLVIVGAYSSAGVRSRAA
jgi:HK97 family phage prohead protease